MSVNQCYFYDYVWQLFSRIRLNLSGTINEKMESTWEVTYERISNEKTVTGKKLPERHLSSVVSLFINYKLQMAL